MKYTNLKNIFEELVDGSLHEDVALIPCKLEGIITANIVLVNRIPEKDLVKLTPLFVFVNDEIGNMLTDIDDKLLMPDKKDMH